MIDFIAANPGLLLMALGVLLFIKAVWPISISQDPPNAQPPPSGPPPLDDPE